jgi:hypothetical protein
MVEFKIRLSYELWDNVFSADNKDLDSIFNTFLNTYLQIFNSCFPEKIFVRDVTQNLGSSRA